MGKLGDLPSISSHLSRPSAQGHHSPGGLLDSEGYRLYHLRSKQTTPPLEPLGPGTLEPLR